MFASPGDARVSRSSWEPASVAPGIAYPTGRPIAIRLPPESWHRPVRHTISSVTLRFRIDPDRMDRSLIDAAGDTIRSGGLVAFPTETVYGLGALAIDLAAIQRLFDAKGRPADDPLIVHVRRGWALESVLAEVSPVVRALTERFWPGPLTIVGPRAASIPAVVTSGLDTVAVRAPAHPVADALLDAVGLPVAAPSANRFGHISPTTADHVLDDLDGRCDVVLDAGDATLGIESTVVAVTETGVVVLRHGALPVEELGVPVVDAPSRPSVSPGFHVRHYAPDSPMRVVEAGSHALLPTVASGVYLGFDDSVPHLPDTWRFFPLGSRDALEAVAVRLYRVLRTVDRLGADLIVAELTARPGLGRAIDDRLRKAASGRGL